MAFFLRVKYIMAIYFGVIGLVTYSITIAFYALYD